MIDDLRLLVPNCISSSRKLKPEVTGNRKMLYSRYWDRQTTANSIDPDQTSQFGYNNIGLLIRIHAICHLSCQQILDTSMGIQPCTMNCDFWLQFSNWRNTAGNQEPQVTGQGYIFPIVKLVYSNFMTSMVRSYGVPIFRVNAVVVYA